MRILDEIKAYTISGRAMQVKELVGKALGEGIAPSIILNDGLLSAMTEVGERFKRNEIYVPNMLVASRALGEGLEVLRPLLSAGDTVTRGKAVIGTVRGDKHDIGKKLVCIMLKGRGFDVTDLGVDVSAEKFIEEAQRLGASIICCSALLTTTMSEMKRVVDLLAEKGLRDRYFVMIGGAAVSEEYRASIGADAYTADAASAADTACELISRLG